MEKVTVIVYTYNELSANSKERARKELSDDFDFTEKLEINECVGQRLEAAGLGGLKDDVRYDFGYTGSDGIAFYGKVNLKEFVLKQGIYTEADLNEKPELEDAIEALYVEVSPTTRHYDNHTTMCVTSDIEDFDPAITEDTEEYRELKRVLGNLEMVLSDVSQELRRACYKIIENIQTEAYIKDYCNENELKFFRDGTLYVKEYYSEDSESTDNSEISSSAENE